MNGSIEQKYRPSTLKDCLLPERVRRSLERSIAKGRCGHLLLTGSPGRGKTTLARAICNELDADSYEVACAEESSANSMRDTIEQYLYTLSMFGRPKVLILEEADNLTPLAQKSLNIALEKTNATVIFTTNYPGQIAESIHSRCDVIDFDSKDFSSKSFNGEILKRARNIAVQEGKDIDDDELKLLIANAGFDIRKTVKNIMRL
jgi:DNA polymerase III delta prime subunit